MSANNKDLAALAAEYSNGVRAYYKAKQMDESDYSNHLTEVSVSYATQDWLNQVCRWSIEEAADDLAYWQEKWTKVAA